MALITCLSFLALPSCQKDELNPDSIADTSPSASAKKVKITGKVKDVDGNWYKTVKIGGQWWMAENLKTTRYNDKTIIPNLTFDSDWIAEDGTEGHNGAYCWYDNEITNKATYGALYNWYAVNTGNLCPIDWHVPTDEEWHTLILYLDGSASLDDPSYIESYIAGDKLKEAGYAHWVIPYSYPDYQGGTNESGFTALPGGWRDYNGTFINIGYYCTMWSYAVASSYESRYRYMGYSYSVIVRSSIYRYGGLSVRCVRDY